MKTKYKNVYLDNTPVRNAGADDLILSGSINKAGDLTSITSVRTGGINGKNLVSASDGTPKVWGYYGSSKTAIDLNVCAEYFKYVVENIKNTGEPNDKTRVLIAGGLGVSLTSSICYLDYFGKKDRYLSMVYPTALQARINIMNPTGDCTNLLKYLNILINLQNQVLEYETQFENPVIESFALDTFPALVEGSDCIINLNSGEDTYVLGPDENTGFTFYTEKDSDNKLIYTFNTLPKPEGKTIKVVKITKEDAQFLLEYLDIEGEKPASSLITVDKLEKGIHFESSGGGSDDPIMEVN